MYEGAQLLPSSNLVAGCLVPPFSEGDGRGVGGGDILTFVFLLILMAGLCLDCRSRDL